MSTNPWRISRHGEYEVWILEGPSGIHPRNDNVDVEVRLNSGERYGATFFTLENVASLMSRWAQTGENAHGLYFNCNDALLVRELTPEVIRAVVADLCAQDELSKWFERLDGHSDQ
jgi:hypothetical protein